MGVIELDGYLLGRGEAGRELVWAPNQGHGHRPLPLQSPLQGAGMVLRLSRRLSWCGCGAGGEGKVVCLVIDGPARVTLTHTATCRPPLPHLQNGLASGGGRGERGAHHSGWREQPCLQPRTLSGKASKLVRTASRQPNLEDLKRRMMSWSVAATTKYSCFSRSSFPSKNWGQCKVGRSQGGGGVT